ncbi:hypothetical protein L1277_002392 [Okibacterium sp. HSC-33S16]|uniref:hypothetical protein n=1 Tax=Okibacterium sp. HSC-33S16 TaxID=2910965 RepID=UPI00209F6A13|nr:hypothetical protein [Okibacterium sp. HSC-33S16]MCP2032289.1 hypothetical protein [Okibacterium sp. HSC-33S16]
MAARSRSVAVGVVVATASLLLSGCGLMQQLEASKPTPTPTPTTLTPTTERRSTVPPTQVDPGTVVATGQLMGDPLISGDVEVRAGRGGGFVLALLGFSSARSEDVELRITPNLVEPGTPCTSSIMNMSYGNLPHQPEQTFTLPADFTSGDPSFLDTVLISHHDFEAFTEGCFVSVLSSAVLHWTLPDMRPGLVVADSGKTGGANGEVTVIDGAPVDYSVAPNDIASEVAARFGMTIDDLFYLNPTRITFVEYPLLEIGEVLNISKAHR